MRGTLWKTLFTAGLVALAGCTNEGSDTADTGGDAGEQCMVDDPTMFTPADESACAPAVTDYQPLSNEEDAWPECVTDDGEYHLIDPSPSAIARIEAYEEAMQALSAVSPNPEAFTEARTIIAREEGLESRLVRREDLHYPAIPESDWDPGVDPDKQCTVEANVAAYPERCAGPARISPLINDAFAAGQQGEGLAAVHKGRIEGALLWFIHLSVYKEANTCLLKAKDCDSSWAYYTGGHDRNGGIGLAAEFRGISELAHQRVWDGITAYRCWRDLYPIETYPSPDDVDEMGRMLLANADSQLADATWYGWSRLVRDRIEHQAHLCGDEAEGNWAFLQVTGAVLSEEVVRIDGSAASRLDAIWASDEVPDDATLEEAIGIIDQIFGCS